MLAIMNRCTRLTGAVLFGAALLTGASYAHSQTLIYSDVTTFEGYGYAPGSGAATIGGDGVTLMVADEVSVISPYGGAKVDGFEFSTATFNSTAVTARPIVTFFNDADGGGPGTFLGGYIFNGITFSSDTVNLFYYDTPNEFTVPTDGNIWAAVSYDNDFGATGYATLAQLNELGQGLFYPPTVGSTPNYFFQSNAAGTYATNNAAGGYYYFGGSPYASFGWQFSAPTLVPEPGSVALLSAFLLTGVGTLSKLRLKKRARA